MTKKVDIKITHSLSRGTDNKEEKEKEKNFIFHQNFLEKKPYENQEIEGRLCELLITTPKTPK